MYRLLDLTVFWVGATHLKGHSWLLNWQVHFLGGLSLHLNHLIAWGVGICYRQFEGHFPLEFLSNLDSRQLDTSLITFYGHF